jgi:hypothetical protein
MELEQRIARLEAVEAIKKLKAKYFFACDNKQPELVRRCFVDGDMHIDYGRVGSFSNADDMVAIYTKYACKDHIVEMHHAQNPQVTMISDTQASATWGLFYYMIDTRQNVVTQLGGFYEDEYRCVGGEWKISKTIYRVSSTQLMDLSEGMAKVIFAGREASSGIDDPSLQAVD